MAKQKKNPPVKDAAYFAKRQRNNIAVRESRAKSKVKREQMLQRLEELRQNKVRLQTLVDEKLKALRDYRKIYLERTASLPEYERCGLLMPADYDQILGDNMSQEYPTVENW